MHNMPSPNTVTVDYSMINTETLGYLADNALSKHQMPNKGILCELWSRGFHNQIFIAVMALQPIDYQQSITGYKH